MKTKNTSKLLKEEEREKSLNEMTQKETKVLLINLAKRIYKV